MRIRTLFLVMLVILLVAATTLLAHGSKDGRILGTVKALHEHHLMITSTDGHEAMVVLTENTELVKGDEAGTREDLIEGARVVVTVGEDGKSAVQVKISDQQ